MMEIDLNDKSTSGQPTEIKLALDDVTPAKKSKLIKPTMAEKLYAERLAAGFHPDADPKTITKGVQVELEEIALKKSDGFVEVVKAEVSAMPNDRDLINQILGQIQATQAISQLSQTFGVSKLAYVKETKAYKALKGMTPNGLELSGTWEEFCGLLGVSDEKANTDIANLKAFGEDALESMTRMGIGYRDLAQYRKLPSDEKTALIEAAKSGDKDQLLDLAESLIEKHIKEKADLNAKVSDLEQARIATGKQINNMNAEIERAEIQLDRLKNRQRLTKFEELTEVVRDECMHFQAGCELNLNSLYSLFETVSDDDESPEKRLRIEQIWVAANVAASRAIQILENISEFHGDLPERIQGQHILTPAEAERWLLDSKMLESKHEAEKLARDVKRESDKPKGRGRPAGAKNKAEE